MTNTQEEAIKAAQYTANTLQQPIHVLHLDDGTPVHVVKTIQPQPTSLLKNENKISTAHLRVN